MHSILTNTVIFCFAIGIAWQGVFELGTAFAVFLLVLGFVLVVFRFILKINDTQVQAEKRDIEQQDPLIFSHMGKYERVEGYEKSNYGSRYLLILVVMVFAFALGTVRMGMAQSAAHVQKHLYDAQLGQKVELVGIVASEPDVRERTTNLTVMTPEHAHILIKARPHQEFIYGDKVKIVGKLEKPSNFKGDAGRVFDYINYLGKDGVYYMIKYPQVSVLSHNNGSPIKAWLYGIKQRYVSVLAELIPEPQAGLAAGITVGAKRALGKELMEAFRNTGLIHIVVLSGFNVTIIIVFLLRATAVLPRLVRYSLATLAVVLFTILTGADAPVVRASAMGLLGVAAIVLGRSYNITRALFVVALAMMVWNPMILMHDIAFQLSVVATLGLIYIAPKIIYMLSPKYIRDETKLKALQKEKLPSLRESAVEIIGVTIAAQIAVLPLLVYYMGEVSIVAVLVNVLALPVIPIAMLMAFIAGTVGMLSSSVALPFAYATHVLLAYIIWLVEFFNALPIATVQIF